jgi:microcystin-dependent protein
VPAEPYLGEINLYPYEFAPRGWALCNGQLLGISQNAALFSLIGTIYGGDGQRTFALPNLIGRVPIGASPTRPLGAVGGETVHTLTSGEMPMHNHMVVADNTQPAGDGQNPAPDRVLSQSSGANMYAPYANVQPMSPNAIGMSGGGAPHENMQPYLVLSYCIALVGVYPPRP